MTTTLTYNGTLVTETCCNCGTPFAIEQSLRESLLRDHTRWFYCPNGHQQHYIGETEAEKLTRQLRAANSGKTWYADQLAASERSKAALRGHLTRARNKVAAGDCPAPGCGRHFANVREHMKFKHPEYHLTDPETGKKAEL